MPTTDVLINRNNCAEGFGVGWGGFSSPHLPAIPCKPVPRFYRHILKIRSLSPPCNQVSKSLNMSVRAAKKQTNKYKKPCKVN